MSSYFNDTNDLTSRQELVYQTQECFRSANYKISKIESNSCVDIIAEQTLEYEYPDTSYHQLSQIRLFLKILGNLNTFKGKQSKDMRLLSYIGGGVPLLIASKYSKNKRLENGVVYTRYEISSINLPTLEMLIYNNINPSNIAIRGKNEPLVSINGFELQRLFQSMDQYNQNMICQELEISRQTLAGYFKGTVKPTLSKYEEIVEFLVKNLVKTEAREVDTLLRKPIPIFFSEDLLLNNYHKNHSESIQNDELKNKINTHLDKLRVTNFWFQSLPWDGFLSDSGPTKSLFTGVVDNKSEYKDHKNRIIKSSKIFEFLNQNGLWFVDSNSIEEGELEDLEKNSPKNTFLISTDDFFNIKQSSKFNKKINHMLSNKRESNDFSRSINDS